LVEKKFEHKNVILMQQLNVNGPQLSS